MNESSIKIGKAEFISIVVLFLLFGGLIGGSAYVAFIPAGTRIILKFSMVLVSLISWLVLSRVERLKRYNQIALSFFAVSLGVLLSYYISGPLMRFFGFSVTTLEGVAMAKFSEAAPIVLCILGLHFATGGDSDGLYFKRGNLKFGLVAAFIGVTIFLGIAIVQIIGSGLKWAAVWSAAPWILIFIFSNAFLEELWFRALFLKKLKPLVGRVTTILITSIVFAGVHISSTYVIDILTFVGATLALGLIWSWLMDRSDSIWAPVLIHAAGDVLAIVGFLAGVNG